VITTQLLGGGVRIIVSAPAVSSAILPGLLAKPMTWCGWICYGGGFEFMGVLPPGSAASATRLHPRLDTPHGRSEFVDFVARQVGVESSDLGFSDWSGRMIKAHRTQIREHFGFASGPSSPKRVSCSSGYGHARSTSNLGWRRFSLGLGAHLTPPRGWTLAVQCRSVEWTVPNRCPSGSVTIA
jgi:hypothetical protein